MYIYLPTYNSLCLLFRPLISYIISYIIQLLFSIVL